jgi:hypothetical protein
MSEDDWNVNSTDYYTEWHVIAGRTFKYSAVCSSGFFAAWLLALFIYWVMRRKSSAERDPLLWYDLGEKDKPEGPVEEDSAGRFGKFMLCVEMLDAVPESAIIANATVSGTISWAFVIAIFALNICNGLATAMDFLSKNRDAGKSSCHDSIRICLFICIFFAVGILSYSISANVYADFVHKYDERIRNADHLLVLLGGTVFGGLLIAGLLRTEDWLHHKSVEAGEVGPKPSFNTRAAQCLALFFVLWFWTVTLSFGLAAVFWVFVEGNSASFIESALEGLSGGAFLATVAGTMIPRIQEDAMKIPWSDVRKKLVGVVMFELGIMCGVSIDVLT